MGGGDVFSSNSNRYGVARRPGENDCAMQLRVEQMAHTAATIDHTRRIQDLATERQQQLANAGRGNNPNMRQNLDEYFSNATAEETSRWAGLEKGFQCWEDWLGRGCPEPKPICGPVETPAMKPPSTGEFPGRPPSGTATTPIGGRGAGVSTRDVTLQCGGGQIFAGVILERASYGITFVQILCRSDWGKGATVPWTAAGLKGVEGAQTLHVICPTGYAVSGLIGTTRDFGRNAQDFRVECARITGPGQAGNLGTFGMMGGSAYPIAGVGQLDGRNQFGQTAQLQPNQVQLPRTWTHPVGPNGFPAAVTFGTSTDDQHRQLGVPDAYPLSRCLDLSATGLTAGVGKTTPVGATIVQTISLQCGGEAENSTAGRSPY